MPSQREEYRCIECAGLQALAVIVTMRYRQMLLLVVQEVSMFVSHIACGVWVG